MSKDKSLEEWERGDNLSMLEARVEVELEDYDNDWYEQVIWDLVQDCQHTMG